MNFNNVLIHVQLILIILRLFININNAIEVALYYVNHKVQIFQELISETIYLYVLTTVKMIFAKIMKRLALCKTLLQIARKENKYIIHAYKIL